jgi:hypothetical protein
MYVSAPSHVMGLDGEPFRHNLAPNYLHMEHLGLLSLEQIRLESAPSFEEV